MWEAQCKQPVPTLAGVTHCCAALAAGLTPQMDKMYAVGGVARSHDLDKNDSAPEVIHPVLTLLEKCIVVPLKTQ